MFIDESNQTKSDPIDITRQAFASYRIFLEKPSIYVDLNEEVPRKPKVEVQQKKEEPPIDGPKQQPRTVAKPAHSPDQVFEPSLAATV